jgi:hypothetical protein
MEPTIRFEPLHMQCQTLIYTDELGTVEGVVEYAVDGGLLLWEGDFSCSTERRARLIAKAEQYMELRGSRCTIVWGKSRV